MKVPKLLGIFKNQRGVIHLLVPALILVILFSIYLTLNKDLSKTLWTSLFNVGRTQAQENISLSPSSPSNLKDLLFREDNTNTKGHGYFEELKWDPSTDNTYVKEYQVFYVTFLVTGQTVYRLVATTQETTYKNLDSNLSDGHGFAVKAVDSDNNLSEYSNIAKPTGWLGGVYDTSYIKIRSVKVEAVGNGTSVVDYSTNNGSFLLNLSPGNYNVSFSKSGYVTQTIPVTIEQNVLVSKHVFLQAQSKRSR